MFRFSVVLLLVCGLTSAFAQSPSISAVLNAASNRTAGLPASGIAQGSIFTIYGSNLGSAACTDRLAFPLSTGFCGVTITVAVNGTSTTAIPIGVYGSQINAVLPSPTPVGTGTITVKYNNQTSGAASIQVVNAAFGAFTPSYGFGQASLTDPNYVLNTIIHPQHPGDTVILWGTGLGPISGSDADPPSVGNVGSPTIYVGNTKVPAIYAGRSGCCAGLDQVAFTIPDNVQGCQVPVAVQAGPEVGNIVTMAVAAPGQNTCSDSVMGQDLVNKLASGGTVSFGYVRLESTSLKIAGVASHGSGAFGDYAYATFSQFAPQTAYAAEYGVSSGYCVSTSLANFFTTLEDLSFAQLDAGSGLTVQGPLNAPGPMVPLDRGYYYLYLSQNVPYFMYSQSRYTVAGTGGANVGAFSVTETASTPSAALSNIITNQALPRASDLTVQWTGGNSALQNGQVTIGGFSETSDQQKFAIFQCTAPASALKFTIPAWVLSTLPASGTLQNGSTTLNLGGLWIGQYNNPTTFSAPGLDRGIITDAFFQGANVIYQ